MTRLERLCREFEAQCKKLTEDWCNNPTAIKNQMAQIALFERDFEAACDTVLHDMPADLKADWEAYFMSLHRRSDGA